MSNNVDVNEIKKLEDEASDICNKYAYYQEQLISIYRDSSDFLNRIGDNDAIEENKKLFRLSMDSLENIFEHERQEIEYKLEIIKETHNRGRD